MTFFFRLDDPVRLASQWSYYAVFIDHTTYMEGVSSEIKRKQTFLLVLRSANVNNKNFTELNKLYRKQFE
jgi:hypothetical protein